MTTPQCDDLVPILRLRFVELQRACMARARTETGMEWWEDFQCAKWARRAIELIDRGPAQFDRAYCLRACLRWINFRAGWWSDAPRLICAAVDIAGGRGPCRMPFVLGW